MPDKEQHPIVAIALPLVKAARGITATVRDEYIKNIIAGVVAELEDVQGLSVDTESPNFLMFVVDFAAWRYASQGESGGLPRHLQWRLHNLHIAENKKDV